MGHEHVIWFVAAGALFVTMALAGTAIARLPLTTAMLYLGVGILLGPQVSGLLHVGAVTDARALERVSEVAVIVSLFTAGLKLRIPLADPRWFLALRLALVSMVITVALIAAVVALGLGLPWGVGVIVGAILAPTDPVLASDVQVEHPFDHNRLRFALTSEASLNDGTAFPFLMLGLGLLGLHELGDGLWRWFAIDVAWATVVGLGVGGALGTAVGRLVLYLRRTHKEAVGLDDFLTLGLIALAYGVALACHAYGFLAVFAAGLALRRVEYEASAEGGAGRPEARPPEAAAAAPASAEVDAAATDPAEAPAYMARAVLAFNEQLERIGEVLVVVIVGALLSPDILTWQGLWLVALLFVVIRPVAVVAGLAGADVTGRERALIGWFGVRGAGSVYYLTYAITHGLPAAFTEQIVGLTLFVIASSVVLHGVSVTRLMDRWGDTASASPEQQRQGA